MQEVATSQVQPQLPPVAAERLLTLLPPRVNGVDDGAALSSQGTGGDMSIVVIGFIFGSSPDSGEDRLSRYSGKLNNEWGQVRFDLPSFFGPWCHTMAGGGNQRPRLVGG